MKAFEKQRKMHNFTNRNCEVLQENSEGKARMRKKKRKSETLPEKWICRKDE